MEKEKWKKQCEIDCWLIKRNWDCEHSHLKKFVVVVFVSICAYLYYGLWNRVNSENCSVLFSSFCALELRSIAFNFFFFNWKQKKNWNPDLLLFLFFLQPLNDFALFLCNFSNKFHWSTWKKTEIRILISVFWSLLFIFIVCIQRIQRTRPISQSQCCNARGVVVVCFECFDESSFVAFDVTLNSFAQRLNCSRSVARRSRCFNFFAQFQLFHEKLCWQLFIGELHTATLQQIFGSFGRGTNDLVSSIEKRRARSSTW